MGLVNQSDLVEAGFPTPGNLAVDVDPLPIKTANLNAHPNARKILNYLASLRNRTEKRVIVGQQLADNSAIEEKYQALVETLYLETGKWVALIGNGYTDNSNLSKINNRLISYWAQGGLVTVWWHTRNPWTGADLWSSIPSGHKLTELITPGSEVYEIWIDRLNRLAQGLSELQRAGVMVLWRPFIEMNGGWFWWAHNENWPSYEEFTDVWRHMFNYLTYEKGLNNLLWVYAPVVLDQAPKRKPPLYYYPGNSYVDIVAPDIYNDDLAKTNIPKYRDSLKALGKPIAFGEFGPSNATAEARTYDYRNLINDIRNHIPEVCYVLAWAGPSNDGRYWAYIYHQHYKEFLNDPWIIDRSELDW
jgi:mannan endo-1,4-beta-mannosidase